MPLVRTGNMKFSNADLLGLINPIMMTPYNLMRAVPEGAYNVRSLQEAIRPIRTSLSDILGGIESNAYIPAKILEATKGISQKMLDMSDSDIANKIRKIQTQYFTE